MNRTQHWLFVLFAAVPAVLAPMTAVAEAEVHVESALDRAEITIGDFITYTVHVDYPPEVRLLEDPLKADLKPFEIIDASAITDDTEEGRLGAKYTYRISIYETGEHTIPPYVLRFATADGEEQEARSEEHRVVVRSVATGPEAAEDIRDLKDPLVLGLPAWKRLGFWLLIALALAAVVALALAFRRRLRRRVKERPARPIPTRPAHEIAYEALESLRQDREGLLRRGEFEPFSVCISTIEREYLLNRYGLLALDRTTEEILDGLEVLALKESTLKGFQEFFEDCDLVKFARETLERSDMLYLIDLAWRLVDETRPPEAGSSPMDTQDPAATDSESPPAPEGRSEDKRRG